MSDPENKKILIGLSAIYFIIFEFTCSFVTMEKERQGKID
jgi:hypothetical protein